MEGEYRMTLKIKSKPVFTRNESEEVASILGLEILKKDIEKSIQEVDRENKGRVSIQDFFDWWIKSSNSPFHNKI